jgi:hypothetical protein
MAAKGLIEGSREGDMVSTTIGRRFFCSALALGLILIGTVAGSALAQNIPEPDPNLYQTFTGEVVYKGTAGTNYGLIGVYNEDEKYAKEFKFKKEDYDKLEVNEGDNVEVTWVGPRNDRTTRNEVKLKKMSSASKD